MESGEIVEYIDDEKIICTVVMESGNQRLRLLTEHNREVKVAAQRLSHRGSMRLDLSAGRNRLVEALRELSLKRNALADEIEIEALWEILNQEQTWIDLETMVGLCFPKAVDDDHQSGVIRALFKSRRYFKFKPDRFLPHTEEQVAAIIEIEQKAAHKNRLIEAGAAWIQSVRSGSTAQPPACHQELTDKFKSFYLFEKESPHYETVRAIMKKADLTSSEAIFNHLAAVGVWKPDENVDLLRYKIPTDFSPSILEQAQSVPAATGDTFKDSGRVDLTHLTTITIDGQSTLDFR